jgi:hypothetical protein
MTSLVDRLLPDALWQLRRRARPPQGEVLRQLLPRPEGALDPDPPAVLLDDAATND